MADELGESGWMPSWWNFSEPPPRQVLPDLLRPENWSPTEAQGVLQMEELVASRFAELSLLSADTGDVFVFPPGTRGIWILVESRFDAASVIVSASVGELLPRHELATLSQCGFSAREGTADLWDLVVLLPAEDPTQAWRLLGRAAAMAAMRVFRRYWRDEWNETPRGWVLSSEPTI